jgi:hypothetical protein
MAKEYLPPFLPLGMQMAIRALRLTTTRVIDMALVHCGIKTDQKDRR